MSKKMGNAPCDRGPCPERDRCKKELLACEPFVKYITHRKDPRGVPNPTREIYMSVFMEDETQ